MQGRRLELLVFFALGCAVSGLFSLWLFVEQCHHVGFS